MQVNDVDMEKRQMILRDFQNGLTYTKAKENIEQKFGNCVGYGARTCERWFTKFKRADFDLTKKPRDKPKAVYTKKKSKKSTKTVKVNEVTFKHQELTAPMDVGPNKIVQTLMKSKPELTITKIPANKSSPVKKATIESDVSASLSKTLPTRRMPKLSPPSKGVKAKNTEPVEMPKLRPRRPRSKGIEIQLPVGTAKKMNTQTLTESHNIGQGRKDTNRTQTPKSAALNCSQESREVTVQFQNINPDVAKNTVRKNNKVVNKQKTSAYLKPQNSMLRIANVAHIERMSPEKNKAFDHNIGTTVPNKRDSLLQTSPLNNQKGIIYLNPQEIFPKSFGGFENSLKRPSTHLKSPPQIHAKSSLVQPSPPLPPPPPPERQDSPILFDSEDSGEDVLFPENICLPAPKIKADDTYTTYWDLESCKPLQLNASEPVLPQPVIPVIEID